VRRAFVTGGSGFLGERLIEILRERGVEVVALARSDRAEEAVRRARASGVARGDLEDLAAMTEGMRGCDVWRLLRLRGQPPVTRMAIRLGGAEVTVRDQKARRDLAYTPRISRDQALATLHASP
jgi:uncharacterized protein YbjT (DUF2867 family)